MSLNEKLEDLEYVDRDEWLGIIKDVCRSQSRRGLCGLVVVLLLFIAAGIYFMTSRYQGGEVGDIAAIVFDLIICFILLWGIVNNARFLLKADSLDTPEQLLQQHEKRIKNDRRAALVCMLTVIISLGGPYAFSNQEYPWSLIDWTMKAVLIALIIYFYYNGNYLRYSDRDNVITERLQDLIGSK